MKLVVTALARLDLRDITIYTYRTWGAAQVDDYVNGLLDCLDKVAGNPTIGRRTAAIPSRFLRVTYRSHFVFFSVVGREVRIVRILHQRMDHAYHLN